MSARSKGLRYMATSFTIKLPKDDQTQISEFFRSHGFQLTDADHAFWLAIGPDVRATFYRSGKLLIQGKEADVWRGLLSEITDSAKPFMDALGRHPKPPPQCWAGTDEAGKGDYFGPLVVAGIAIERTQLELLLEIGVDDSKTISDERILKMDRPIRQVCRADVLMIGPAKYNELYARIGNLNRLMAWAHAKVINNLLTQTGAPISWILIDRFAPESTMRKALARIEGLPRLDQWPKAESDPAVGAASILARAAFLRGVKALSKKYAHELPLGAGAKTLTAAHRFIDKHGRSRLHNVAKLHFSNTDKIGF